MYKIYEMVPKNLHELAQSIFRLFAGRKLEDFTKLFLNPMLNAAGKLKLINVCVRMKVTFLGFQLHPKV